MDEVWHGSMQGNIVRYCACLLPKEGRSESCTVEDERSRWVLSGSMGWEPFHVLVVIGLTPSFCVAVKVGLMLVMAKDCSATTTSPTPLSDIVTVIVVELILPSGLHCVPAELLLGFVVGRGCGAVLFDEILVLLPAKAWF